LSQNKALAGNASHKAPAARGGIKAGREAGKAMAMRSLSFGASDPKVGTSTDLGFCQDQVLDDQIGPARFDLKNPLLNTKIRGEPMQFEGLSL
jgi:hypothetical protein